MNNYSFDFTKIHFPEYKYLLSLNTDKRQKLLLFDLGVFGKGFFVLFEDGYPEVRFVTSCFNNTKNAFLLDLNGKYAETEYERFCSMIVDYCSQAFIEKYDCNDCWPNYLDMKWWDNE